VVNVDWKKTPLGKVVTLQRGYDLPHRLRKPGRIPIITSSGIGDTHSHAIVAGPGVVTGRYGTIGEVFYIDRDFWPLNTTLYVRDFHGNDPLFVSYLLRTVDFQSHSGKTGVPGVNRNDLHEITVEVPRTKTEQEVIARALSDVDALIDALDNLIAKKHDLKQGVMQQLLTGKQRLSGFNGELGYKQTEVGRIPEDWGVSTVGEEFSIQLGKMLDAEKNVGVPKPYLGNRAVQWGRIDLTDIADIRLTASDLQRYRLRDGDILVCEGGEVGRAAIWRQPIDECYYQKALHRLRPKRGYSVSLFVNVLQRLASNNLLLNFVTQTSIAHLPKDKFQTVPIPLPSTKAEQEAIANVLSDMDAEIAALERRRDKTRALKQGMMQELLTGKTRLV
jgi:type I restriction enzyme, S subunit